MYSAQKIILHTWQSFWSRRTTPGRSTGYFGLNSGSRGLPTLDAKATIEVESSEDSRGLATDESSTGLLSGSKVIKLFYSCNLRIYIER